MKRKTLKPFPKICTVLLKRGLSVKWYILGYGDRETQIREAIQAVHMEDFVVLLGKKENPYPYMRMCDIYVQPSVYEGKCVAVREGAAAREACHHHGFFPPRTASCETAQTA